MLRIILSVLLTLTFVAFISAASADYGYTETSQIPMAVDFNISVAFDAQGNPQIVTDYPFEETGARVINLVYNKEDISEAISLQYEYPSGSTSLSSWDSNLYNNENIQKKGYEDIRSGKVVLDDSVYISTNSYSAETDWVLVYSLSQHCYLSYEEKTHAQAFNAMGSGGILKALYYQDGMLSSSRVMKRTENADLIIDRSGAGDIEYASVYQYQPVRLYYDYDASTGFFGGRRLSSLGFEDSDIEIEPLAMTGSRTGRVTTSVTVKDNIPAVTKGHTAFTIAGGLLAGLLIGLTLFRMFRRKKNNRPESVLTGETAVQNGAPVQEEAFEPQTRYMRS